MSDCPHIKTKTKTNRRAGTRETICKACGETVGFERIMTEKDKKRRDRRR